MLANQIKATHEPGFMLAGKCDPCSFSKIKNNHVEQQDHLNRKSDQRVTPGSGPSRSSKRLGTHIDVSSLSPFLNMASGLYCDEGRSGDLFCYFLLCWMHCQKSIHASRSCEGLESVSHQLPRFIKLSSQPDTPLHTLTQVVMKTSVCVCTPCQRITTHEYSTWESFIL